MPIKGASKLSAKLARLQKHMATRLPKLVQAEAVRHFRDNFKLQGFMDGSVRRWAPTKKGKPGRVLRATGALQNSIRGGAASWSRIEIVAGGPDVPYAAIHNEGGLINRQVTRRPHSRKAHKSRRKGRSVMVGEAMVRRHQARMNVMLRRRQFMGPSRALSVKLSALLVREIHSVMK